MLSADERHYPLATGCGSHCRESTLRHRSVRMEAEFVASLLRIRTPKSQKKQAYLADPLDVSNSEFWDEDYCCMLARAVKQPSTYGDIVLELFADAVGNDTIPSQLGTAEQSLNCLMKQAVRAWHAPVGR